MLIHSFKIIIITRLQLATRIYQIDTGKGVAGKWGVGGGVGVLSD
jgi:hypothetical protein